MDLICFVFHFDNLKSASKGLDQVKLKTLPLSKNIEQIVRVFRLILLDKLL